MEYWRCISPMQYAGDKLNLALPQAGCSSPNLANSANVM